MCPIQAIHNRSNRCFLIHFTATGFIDNDLDFLLTIQLVKCIIAKYHFCFISETLLLVYIAMEKYCCALVIFNSRYICSNNWMFSSARLPKCVRNNEKLELLTQYKKKTTKKKLSDT